MGWFGIYGILISKEYERLAEFLKDSQDGVEKIEEACEQIAIDEVIARQRRGQDITGAELVIIRRKKEIYAETIEGLKEFGYERM